MDVYLLTGHTWRDQWSAGENSRNTPINCIEIMEMYVYHVTNWLELVIGMEHGSRYPGTWWWWPCGYLSFEFWPNVFFLTNGDGTFRIYRFTGLRDHKNERFHQVRSVGFFRLHLGRPGGSLHGNFLAFWIHLILLVKSGLYASSLRVHGQASCYICSWKGTSRSLPASPASYYPDLNVGMDSVDYERMEISIYSGQWPKMNFLFAWGDGVFTETGQLRVWQWMMKGLAPIHARILECNGDVLEYSGGGS